MADILQMTFFKCIFMNEIASISFYFSLKFALKVWINNILALVQIAAWRRPGNKLLSEPMVVSILMHICVTQPQWVNSFVPHYNDIIMSVIASQITGASIVYSAVCLRTDQRKHQSSTSLAFVRGTYQWPVNSLCKGPVTRKVFPFDDFNMMLVTAYGAMVTPIIWVLCHRWFKW